EVPVAEEEIDEEESEKMKDSESVINLLSIDPIEFEFGYALIPLVDASQGGDLLDRIIMIRRQLAIELGVVVPVVRIRDRKSTRLNSSHVSISYAVFCLKEKITQHDND